MKNAHNRSTAPTKAGRRRENWGPAKVPPTLARHRMADQGHLPPADFRDRDGALWHGTSRRPGPASGASPPSGASG